MSSFQTLATSELAKLDIEQTNPDQIKQAFCRDMARVTRSYEVRKSFLSRKFFHRAHYFCEISKVKLFFVNLCTYTGHTYMGET